MEFTEQKPRPTVILDRDGTLIVDKHYLHDSAEVEILPFVVEGLRLLQQANFQIFVATNQSGIGRGYYTIDDMHAVNARMEELLKEHGIFIDGIFFCPHAPDQACTCRKPATGMLEQIRLQADIQNENCFVVGDKDCDVNLGINAHMASVLVRTGYGIKTEEAQKSKPLYIADSFLHAAQWILAHHVDGMR